MPRRSSWEDNQALSSQDCRAMRCSLAFLCFDSSRRLLASRCLLHSALGCMACDPTRLFSARLQPNRSKAKKTALSSLSMPSPRTVGKGPKKQGSSPIPAAEEIKDHFIIASITPQSTVLLGVVLGLTIPILKPTWHVAWWPAGVSRDWRDVVSKYLPFRRP